MRMLVCSIDGMRPDGLAKAHTPVMDRLISEGAYCANARSVMPSVTLPCHMSMLRGVEVGRHGVNTNTFHPLARPVPSVMDVAGAAGRKCGMFYNWEPLRDCSDPGSLSVSVFLHDNTSYEGDAAVAEAACRHWQNEDLDLTFVYFGNTDSTGHKYGWMSDEYLDAISNADRCVGRMMQELDRLGRLSETSVLVLADHGGHERSHGTEMEEDMTIPWMLWGPGVKPGERLSNSVRLYDTCATVAHLLGLQQHPEWDGQPVREALG